MKQFPRASIWERRASLATRVLRLLRLVVHLVQVRLSVAWFLPRSARQARRDRAMSSAARLLDIFDVRLVVTGTAPARGDAALIVANHISWLDVQALGAVTGARFVAKSEVRRWPIVGKIAERQGTLFIKRGSCRGAWRAKNSVATALRDGDAVAVFPEGTTTDGRRVQPFRAALLEAAVECKTPVYPVTILYQTVSGSGNEAAAFVGDMTFASSLLRVAREPVMAVELHFGRPIPARNRTRRELAALAQLTITETLALAADDSLRAALRSASVPRARVTRSLGRSAWPPTQAPAAA